MKIKVIDPVKIRSARGNRTRAEIVEKAENKFSEQQLLGWEKGFYRPSDLNLLYLVGALGVTQEDLMSEVGVEELEKVA